jgi:hypothetical protein
MSVEQVNRGDVEDFLAVQRDVLELNGLDLRRRYIHQPDRDRLVFGAGEPAEQTLIGNEEHPFYGVTVLNPTAKTVFLGFQAGQAQGSPLFVPAGTGLTWPARYTQLSVAVSPADAAAAQASVTVLRLQYPPEPLVFSYSPALAAAVVKSQPEDAVVTNAASVTILAANQLRKGMEIVNAGLVAVRLALGQPATAKHGLLLSGGGGTWNGLLSNALWTGSVTAITEAGETTVAVVEL